MWQSLEWQCRHSRSSEKEIEFSKKKEKKKKRTAEKDLSGEKGERKAAGDRAQVDRIGQVKDCKGDREQKLKFQAV